MKISFSLACLLLFLVSSTVSGQAGRVDPIYRLYPKGNLPSEFRQSSHYSDTLKNKLSAMGNQKLSRQELRDFQLSIDYTTSAIVRSGRLLYGDTVTQYLSGILDVLLVNHPGLRSRIRVYANKSTNVNAFMLPDGKLFLNLGIVANATCEADLAFIMAHEIIHFTRFHSMDLFVDGLKRDWKEDNYIFDYLGYHYRSRVQETESDSRGLTEFFLKTGYDRASVSRVFDILQFAHLPFEELQFKREEVETQVYRFPDDYFASRVNVIKNDEREPDTLSSHPNIPFRRINAQKILDETDEGGNKPFIQSEEAFHYVRNLARYECLNQYLIDGKYAEALFNVRVMERDITGNRRLADIRVAALYGIAKTKKSGMGNTLPSEKNTEGSFHGLVKFLRLLKSREACLLALREAWQARERYPDDEYLKLVSLDLMNDIFIGYKMKITDFSDYGIDDKSYLRRIDSLAQITSKYDAGKAKTVVIPEPTWETARYMLADIKQNTAFHKDYNAILAADQNLLLQEMTYKKPKLKNVIGAKQRFLFMEPAFYLGTQRDEGLSNTSKRASRGYHWMENGILACSRALNIEAEMLNPFEDKKEDAYKEYAWHCEIVREMTESEQGNRVAYSMMTARKPGLERDTRPIAVFSQVAMKDIPVSLDLFLFDLLTIPMFPFLPAAILNVAMPTYDSDLYLYLLDSRTGKVIFTEKESFNEKIRDDYVKAFLYNSLLKGKEEVLKKQ